MSIQRKTLSSKREAECAVNADRSPIKSREIKRKKFSKAAKTQILDKQKYTCPFCQTSLREGAVEYDHILPLALGGADRVENIQALHSSCHAIFKTKGDIQVISKAKRQGGETGQQKRRKEGKTKKIRSPGFNKTLRKKMNGKVERK